MTRMKHVSEANLALYGAGDLGWWNRPFTSWHLAQCPRCRERMEAYRNDQQHIRQATGQMPPHLNWESLALEMTANIRVGLAAGECVAPRRERRSLSTAWRVTAASLGFSALLTAAWWMNTPVGESETLGRAVRAMTTRSVSGHGGIGQNTSGSFGSNPGVSNPGVSSPSFSGRSWTNGLTGGIFGSRSPLRERFAAWEESPALVGVSASGIELQENGSLLGLSQGTERPVAVSLSVKGSARARYVDSDTGQVTITGVYAQ